MPDEFDIGFMFGVRECLESLRKLDSTTIHILLNFVAAEDVIANIFAEFQKKAEPCSKN